MATKVIMAGRRRLTGACCSTACRARAIARVLASLVASTSAICSSDSITVLYSFLATGLFLYVMKRVLCREPVPQLPDSLMAQRADLMGGLVQLHGDRLERLLLNVVHHDRVPLIALERADRFQNPFHLLARHQRLQGRSGVPFD